MIQSRNARKMVLRVKNNRLELQIQEGDEVLSYCVDFLSSKREHRRVYGGGQLIAKAVGIKSDEHLRVLDLTAGFGQDAYVLACLGCDVTMVERSEIIFQLLEDGIKRAKEDEEFEKLKFKLIQADSIEYLNKVTEKNYPDIICIDPMFPERKKSALVKKESRILRAVVGDDQDSDALLKLALSIAFLGSLQANTREVAGKQVNNSGSRPCLGYGNLPAFHCCS